MKARPHEQRTLFISYSHADRQSVFDLYHQLKDSEAKLWLDQFELSPGASLQQEIERALRTSDAVLMVHSQNSNTSKWIQFEGSYFYAMGQSDKKPIIPIILDDAGKSLAKELPFLQGSSTSTCQTLQRGKRMSPSSPRRSQGCSIDRYDKPSSWSLSP